MGDVDRETHVGKVEPIAQPDESQGDNVMCHKLFEVLPRLLELQHQDDRLLGPIARLEQIVSLEHRGMFTMREAFKHRSRVEVPNVRLAHHIESERPKHSKVHGGVDLLHEAGHLCLSLDAAPLSPWTNYSLHQEFASKGQENRVEGHERNVLLAFAIHHRLARGFWFFTVGQEDRTMHWVGRSRVHSVSGQDD